MTEAAVTASSSSSTPSVATTSSNSAVDSNNHMELMSASNPWKTLSPSTTNSSLASPVHSVVSNGVDSGISTAGDDSALAVNSLAIDMGSVGLGFEVPTTKPKKFKAKKSSWKPLPVTIVRKDPKEGQRDIRGGVRRQSPSFESMRFDNRKSYPNQGKKVPFPHGNQSSSSVNFSQGRSSSINGPINNLYHAQPGMNNQRNMNPNNNQSNSSASKENVDTGSKNKKEAAAVVDSKSASTGQTRPTKFPEEPFPEPTQKTGNNPSSNNKSHPPIRGDNTSRQQTNRMNSHDGGHNNNHRVRQHIHSGSNRGFNNNNGSSDGGDLSSCSGRGSPSVNGFSPFHQEDIPRDLQFYVDYVPVVPSVQGTTATVVGSTTMVTANTVPAGITVLPTPEFVSASPLPSVTSSEYIFVYLFTSVVSKYGISVQIFVLFSFFVFQLTLPFVNCIRESSRLFLVRQVFYFTSPTVPLVLSFMSVSQ